MRDDNCDGEHSAASMEVDRSRLQDEPRVAAQGCSAMDAPRQKKTRPSKRDLEENDGERAEGQRPEPAVGTYSSSRQRQMAVPCPCLKHQWAQWGLSEWVSETCVHWQSTAQLCNKQGWSCSGTSLEFLRPPSPPFRNPPPLFLLVVVQIIAVFGHTNCRVTFCRHTLKWNWY